MEKKIIIIGAGAAGFAAASKLILSGFKNVLLLEAENRIGGRVHTIPYGANVLDMGAQWCHGQKGNVVYEMAKDKHLLSSNKPRYESFTFVRSNGQQVPQHISDKLVNLFNQILDRNDKRDVKSMYAGSFGNYVAEKYFKALRSDEFSDVDADLRLEILEWFHRLKNMYVACDSWYEASGRDYIEYWDCDGDLLLDWKDKGYSTVFKLLQNKIPVGSTNVIDIESRVLLNKEVSKITYSTSNENRTKVTCSDDSSYSADHVICTVSLGVLKNHHWSLFEPLLPRHKIKSIESMGYGTVDKIYVEFEKPFWSDDWEGVSFLWQPEQLKEIHADPINGAWLKNTLGFYIVHAQPNILCGWISGMAGRKMEAVNQKQLKDGVIKVLSIFLKGFNRENVKNVFCSKWCSNPHFLGSYTFYSLNADANGATTGILAEPIMDLNGKPVIQFAGEATHAHYYSTVHGAIETGWREAQRLIDMYNKPKL